MLEAVQGGFDAFDPQRIDGLDLFPVGELDGIIGTGDGFHEKPVEIVAAQGPKHAFAELLINRVDNGCRFFLVFHGLTALP